MKERAVTGQVDAFSFAETYAWLGSQDEALDWLEQSIDEHAPVAVWTKAGAGTVFRPIAETERFKKLVERMDYPD